MTNLSIETREGLPIEMRALLRDYPREAWPGHPNFAASIANWMGAHTMFRKLAEVVSSATEQFLDKELEDEAYVERLGWYGNALVRSLHGHHGWEDRQFFPELKSAEKRFGDGLDMLESDHVALDVLLDDFTRHGNRLIQLHQLDPGQSRDQARNVFDHAVQIGKFLQRHLNDEEDLAVPILLHHKMRG